MQKRPGADALRAFFLFSATAKGYFAPFLLEDFRPVERPAIVPEVFLEPVLPLICAALFAATGMLLRPLVVLADFRLLVFSFAILICDTYLLTEVPLFLSATELYHKPLCLQSFLGCQ
jgi:hypothetical protein